jgi:hypothetical protein
VTAASLSPPVAYRLGAPDFLIVASGTGGDTDDAVLSALDAANGGAHV